MATPIVELSNHEDTFLGDFLDLSLDLSCTGYDGDQESEEEKHADGMYISILYTSQQKCKCIL